jgi:hypothetical protein
MNKKYKHITTGDIAELINDSGYKLNKNTLGLIPRQYIEYSNDWIEITNQLQHNDLVYRIWPSGKKSLGKIVDVPELYKYKEKSNTLTGSSLRFIALETYLDEGSVSAGNSYGLGQFKYEKLNSDTYWEIITFIDEEIKSVKRLIDNEMFNIGDKVIINNLKATSFFIEIIHIVDHDILLEGNGYSCLLTDCFLIEPLFTTADNIHIYNGDTFYEANLIYHVKEWSTDYPVYLNPDILKTLFAHKSNAEDYIINHKPILSLDDLINKAFDYSLSNNYLRFSKDELINIIKSKLKT